ncbi:MAG: PDZ domain-containing protein [Clostridia bacterium]|nr:PDZ domain-containing protein [Clostridia bacterium]
MENEQKNVAKEDAKKDVDNVAVNKKTVRKKITTIIAFCLSIVLAFLGGYFSRYVFSSKEIKKTHDLVHIIEKFCYVLDENGNPRELTETDYAKALADGLPDQYLTYYTKEEYDKIANERKGNRTGFGVSIYNLESELPKIISVVGNSPAEKKGVKVGDIINSATIEGQQTVNFANSKELNQFLFACPSDKKVTFNISRGLTNLTIEIQKAFYVASYVTYYDSERKMTLDTSGDNSPFVEYTDEKMNLPQDTALIRLSSFEGGVASQLRATLSYMQEKGRTKLILDLRDNAGGYMSALCDVAEQLIFNGGKKTLIAHAKGKTSSEDFYMTSNKENSFITNISVLANDGTASASECLIGAMLHYGERFSIDNLVVEKNDDGVAKTFGKGIMQTTYLLTDGSAIKLTTARIFWPNKTTCIHSKGILPTTQNATERGQSAIDRAISILQD